MVQTLCGVSVKGHSVVLVTVLGKCEQLALIKSGGGRLASYTCHCEQMNIKQCFGLFVM